MNNAMTKSSKYVVELDREEDGRWLADVPAIPGVMSYGDTPEQAIRNVEGLARSVMDDRREQGEPFVEDLSFTYPDR